MNMRKLSLLLLAPASLSLASPTTLHSARQAPPPSPSADLLGSPPINIGYYTFVSCSDTQGQTLTDLFTQTAAIITTQIVPALATPNPNQAQDPFPVFFKDGNPRDHINATFTGILGQHLYHPGSDRNWRPRIICLNGGVTELERAGAVCEQGIGPVSFTQDEGANSVVYLCPAFFDLPVLLTKGENCPTVDAAVDPTKFYDHKDAVQNQFSVMIHELAHAVLVDADSPTNNYPETFPLNDIIALPSNRQYWNANNYAYYAACLYAGCTTFPTRPTAKMMRMKRQTASADALVPAILDKYPYPTGLDTVALAANLTALGYEDKPVALQDLVPGLQFGSKD
ncbi:MAG: hypothetical protein OHK93_005082 [Ramalina farinacea]|uniref:Lysine-specific metallo-endopeptidase domain-containing protein n=1 Tax=Ramalina farinacea TaxID=258253 RepID=A0AA43QXB7_9LECA|nr:hypothetical protein [Ramalina farinacea]